MQDRLMTEVRHHQHRDAKLAAALADAKLEL
jgi:hypothetical protein